MKVMMGIIHENPSFKPVPEIYMLLSAFEIVSIKPIVLRPATIVNAATIKITTFENTSPIHIKKAFTSLEQASIPFIRKSSVKKANAKEKSVTSTRITLANIKNIQKPIARTSGITGKRAYHVGTSSGVFSSFSISNTACSRPSLVLSVCFCQK